MAKLVCRQGLTIYVRRIIVSWKIILNYLQGYTKIVNGGDNRSRDYRGSSGPGSALEYNKTTYIPFLRKFFKEHNIHSVVDLGCGDFRCGEAIYGDLDILYNGYDAYSRLIELHQNTYTKYNFTVFCFNHVLSLCSLLRDSLLGLLGFLRCNSNRR